MTAARGWLTIVLLALTAVLVGCKKEPGGLYLSVVAEPQVAEATSLVMRALVVGDGSEVRFEQTFSVVGRDLGATPYVIKVEAEGFLDGTEAVVSLIALSDGTAIGSYAGRQIVSATEVVDVVLTAIGKDCDEDGDGYKACEPKPECCSLDEAKDAADCDDADAGANPFADTKACRICSAACGAVEADIVHEVVGRQDVKDADQKDDGAATEDVGPADIQEHVEYQSEFAEVGDAVEVTDLPSEVEDHGGFEILDTLTDEGTQDAPDACQPDCAGAVCGDDGCGGSCGECSMSKICIVGACICPDECGPVGKKECTDTKHFRSCSDPDSDTCLEWSPASECTYGSTCDGGLCVCAGSTDDDCDNVDDDCDGQTDEGYLSDTSCFKPGPCSALDQGSSCAGGVETPCTTGAIANEACNGVDDDCDGSTDEGGDTLCLPGEACGGEDGCLCLPDCSGRFCGSDGCGGSCGYCSEVQACAEGLCVADPDMISISATDDDATITLYTLSTSIEGDVANWCAVRIMDLGAEVALQAGDTVSVWVYEDDLTGDDLVWSTEFQVTTQEAETNHVDRTFDCGGSFGADPSGTFELYALATVAKDNCGWTCTEDRPETATLIVSQVADDIREPDDKLDDAKAVQAGQLAGLICRDEDWFSVHLDQETNVLVQAVHRPSAGRLSVSLVDSYAVSIGSGTYEPDRTTLRLQAIGPGDYYIVTRPQEDSNYNSYGLFVSAGY